MDRGILSVSGKREEERSRERQVLRARAHHGHVHPPVRLPENVNADAVEASHDNGVLEVRIPVLEQAKPRKIEVRKVEVRQADDQPGLAA